MANNNPGPGRSSGTGIPRQPEEPNNDGERVRLSGTGVARTAGAPPGNHTALRRQASTELPNPRRPPAPMGPVQASGAFTPGQPNTGPPSNANIGARRTNQAPPPGVGSHLGAPTTMGGPSTGQTEPRAPSNPLNRSNVARPDVDRGRGRHNSATNASRQVPRPESQPARPSVRAAAPTTRAASAGGVPNSDSAPLRIPGQEDLEWLL